MISVPMLHDLHRLVVATERALEDYYTEIERLHEQREKDRSIADATIEDLKSRLLQQVHVAESTRETAHAQFQRIFEVYPDAMAIVLQTGAKMDKSSLPAGKLRPGSPVNSMTKSMEQDGDGRRATEVRKRGGDDPVDWSVMKGKLIARDLNLPQYMPDFTNEAVDGHLLLSLEEVDQSELVLHHKPIGRPY